MEHDLKVYVELTYIETYDGQILSTPTNFETVSKILQKSDSQFLNLWTELINKSNIKRVFLKGLSDVEKVLFSIEDRQLREKLKAEIKEREKKGLRVNTEILQNLIDRLKND